MSTRIRMHLQRNVVGYVALFFALSGGAAWATHPGGANTISSTDIINGQVQEPDIATSAVRSAEVGDGTIGGADIADDGVRGPDVREGTLDFGVLQARLRSACAGGTAISAVDAAGRPTCVGTGGPPSGPAGGDLEGSYPNPTVDDSSLADTVDTRVNTLAGCNPTGTGFVSCASLDLIFSGDVAVGKAEALVIASIGWHANVGGAAGECRLHTGVTGLAHQIGETTDTTDSTHRHTTTIFASVSGGPGQLRTVSVQCNETESNIVYGPIVVGAIGQVD